MLDTSYVPAAHIIRTHWPYWDFDAVSINCSALVCVSITIQMFMEMMTLLISLGKLINYVTCPS